MKNFYLKILPVIACTVIFCSGCSKSHPKEQPRERTWLTMGTFASITAHCTDVEQFEKAFTLAHGCFSNINSTLSTYLPDSEISQINRTTNRVDVSHLTADIMSKTIHYCEISDGAFDPTVRPLIEMWGFNGATVPPRIPPESEIAQTLKRIGYRHIKLNRITPSPSQQNNPYLLAGDSIQSSVSIDLGGIAKGYAVDMAYNAINQAFSNNPPAMLINLGGNIRCIGSATTERPWRIGVRDPFVPGKLVGALTLKNGEAVATSGNYERYVIISGKRYAHIINPRTGYPIQGMAEVTIVAPNATASDALSTAIYITGHKNAPHVLAKAGDCRAIIIPDKKPVEIWVSPNFRDSFTVYKEYRNNVHILASPEETE